MGSTSELGLLHIDIDGNDYWIWKKLNTVSPVLLILEYNSVFGIERSITVLTTGLFAETRLTIRTCMLVLRCGLFTNYQRKEVMHSSAVTAPGTTHTLYGAINSMTGFVKLH
jgi:hypothetical protein